jgi:hypothetical protein
MKKSQIKRRITILENKLPISIDKAAEIEKIKALEIELYLINKKIRNFNE